MVLELFSILLCVGAVQVKSIPFLGLYPKHPTLVTLRFGLEVYMVIIEFKKNLS